MHLLQNAPTCLPGAQGCAPSGAASSPLHTWRFGVQLLLSDAASAHILLLPAPFFFFRHPPRLASPLFFFPPFPSPSFLGNSHTPVPRLCTHSPPHCGHRASFSVYALSHIFKLRLLGFLFVCFFTLDPRSKSTPLCTCDFHVHGQ